MSAIRIKILSLFISLVFGLQLALPSGLAVAQEGVGVGAEIGSMLSQTAGAIGSMNEARQMQEYQKQLLASLNSQEAQLIQMRINASAQELSNLVSRELLPCLQRNSIAASSLQAAATNPATMILGQTACRDPKVDTSILDEELTCGSAQRAGEAAETEKKFQACRQKQMETLQKVVSCFDGFDSKMDAAGQKLREFINQRTTFVMKALEAFNNNIAGHETAIARIVAEVEGPDGYKDQVAKLDAILEALDQSLSGAAPNADRLPASVREVDGRQLQGGLEERVRHLATKEGVDLANSLYEQIVGGTERCFVNGATSCDTGSGALPASQCLARLVCNGLPQGRGFEARCQRNKDALAKAMTDLGAEAGFNQRTSGGNMDPMNKQQILDAAAKETQRLEALVSRSIEKYANAGLQQGFTDGVNLTMLREKIHDQIERCARTSARQFNELYDTPSGTRNGVQQALETYRAKQIALQDDLNDWIRIVADRMTKFRTKFTSTFSSTLKQFASDCRAPASTLAPGFQAGGAQAQQMLGCLKTLRERLEGGLNGTNGEPPTTIQVPVINGTPGAAGATSQVIQQTCTGFKDCIQQLDVARKIHGEQKDALKSQRQANSANHNRIIEGILDQVGAAFNAGMNSPAGLKGMLARVNGLLSANGVSMQLNMKPREKKEKLEKDEASSPDDEKSQIYKTPEDLLGVLASRSGLQQISQEDVNDIKKNIDEKLGNSSGGKNSDGTGIKGRISRADKALAKSREKLRKCTPVAEDYNTIASLQCERGQLERICGRGITASLGQMEKIGSIIADDQNDGKNSGLNRRQRNLASFRACIQDMKDMEKLSSEDRLVAADLKGEERRKYLERNSNPMASLNRDFECYNETVDTIRGFYGQARSDYRNRHDNLLGNMDAMIAACEEYRFEKFKEVSAFEKKESRALSRIRNSTAECNQTNHTKEHREKVASEYLGLVSEVTKVAHEAVELPATEPTGPVTPAMDALIPPANLKILKETVKKWIQSKQAGTIKQITQGITPTNEQSIKAFLSNPSDASFEDYMAYTNGAFPYTFAQLKELKADWKTYMKEMEKRISSTPALQERLEKFDRSVASAAEAYALCVSQEDTETDSLENSSRDLASSIDKKHEKKVLEACDEVKAEAKSLAEQAAKSKTDAGSGLFDDAK